MPAPAIGPRRALPSSSQNARAVIGPWSAGRNVIAAVAAVNLLGLQPAARLQTLVTLVRVAALAAVEGVR
jgi:hypothetical protein